MVCHAQNCQKLTVRPFASSFPPSSHSFFTRAEALCEGRRSGAKRIQPSPQCGSPVFSMALENATQVACVSVAQPAKPAIAVPSIISDPHLRGSTVLLSVKACEHQESAQPSFEELGQFLR